MNKFFLFSLVPDTLILCTFNYLYMVVILSLNSLSSFALFGLLMVCLRNRICQQSVREHEFKGTVVQNFDS